VFESTESSNEDDWRIEAGVQKTGTDDGSGGRFHVDVHMEVFVTASIAVTRLSCSFVGVDFSFWVVYCVL